MRTLIFKDRKVVGLITFSIIVVIVLLVNQWTRVESRSKGGRSMSSANLSASWDTTSGAITVGWNPNTESNLAGYYLYYGYQSGVYSTPVPVGISPNPMVTVGGLAPNTVYFSLRAYNNLNMFSPFSPELVVAPAPTPTPSPIPTATATATATPSATIAATPTATATVVPSATPTATPDFTLTMSAPTTRTVPASGGSPTFNLKMAPLNGFNKPVMLSYDINGMPANGYIGAKLGSQPLTSSNKSCTITVYPLADCPPGTYVVTITGISSIPPLTHTAQCTVIKSP